MSRVLVSALAFSVLSGSVLSASPAFSQSLSINPFPMEKAATLSVQRPQMIEDSPVERFAEEAEDEILILKLEKAELQRKLEEKDAIAPEMLGDQSLNAPQNRAPERVRPAVSLKQKNRELAQELRQSQSMRSDKADLAFAMKALEVQRKADNAGAMVPVGGSEVSVAHANAVRDVRMTPMPLNAGDRDAFISGADRFDVAAPADKTSSNLTNIKVLAVPASGVDAERAVVRQAHGIGSSVRAGESLEDVLRSWSQAEGAGFLWKTTMRFDVPKAMSVQGHYEDLVASLLGQFDRADVRPIGTLHVDPVTNFKTLTVMSE